MTRIEYAILLVFDLVMLWLNIRNYREASKFRIEDRLKKVATAGAFFATLGITQCVWKLL